MNSDIAYLQSLISIGMLFVALFWLYRDYKLDSFRQQLFKLRDELFDDAIKNDIAFDHVSYQVLRSTINGFIQYGHRLNVFQVIAFLALAEASVRSRDASFQGRFESGLSSLDVDSRKLLKVYRMKMNVLMMEHVITSSPISLVFIFAPIGYMVKTKEIIQKFLKRYKSQVNLLDSAALARGEALS